MKMIVKILIGLGILIGIVLVAALFIKKDYKVVRSIHIAQPRQKVFDFIKFIKNHDQFSKWIRTDPNMKKVYKGTDGTVGFVYAWDGNKEAGKGEQEIKAIREGQELALEIRFIRPFEGVAQSQMVAQTASDSTTQVTWTFSSKMKYPMNIMLLVMNMDAMLGKDMQTSLEDLKKILEKNEPSGNASHQTINPTE